MSQKIKLFQDDDIIWQKKAFPNKLQENEDIVLIVREDIILMVFRAIGYVATAALLTVLKVSISSLSTDAAAASAFDSIYYIALMLIVTAFAYTFHNYYLSMQMVTSDRLVDIDQRGLFNRELNELAMDNVEDVTYKQVGPVSALFNFGTVSVQTAAEVATKENKSQALTGGFVFENVPSPAEIHAIITQLYHSKRNRDAHNTANIQAEYMAKIIGNNK
jgi:membrane protein YdbS with pleckstrin-like domain